ncbi:metallophosphoesterase family protein [Brevibacillus sp. NPDC058079]|uniref:metallophosphoesterase family protein n=1 Tax=Brevibacillus sp. NPDC058079 TaxID=3346330 RepID=UPI0036E8CD3E
MRKFFMTDIHGDFDAMQRLLDYVSFDPTRDRIVFGGDMIDRGKDSGKVVKAIKLLCEQHPNHVKAVIGNHEEMMGWYLDGRSTMWLIHGGKQAIESFKSVFRNEAETNSHLKWACRLPLFIEDDEFVYVHAGLNPFQSIDNQNREILWMQESEFYRYYKDDLLAITKNKPIIHGHTPVERIYFDGARMNCDMGSSTYEVLEERGLGLVDLTAMEYYVYKPNKKKIEKRKVVS